MEYPPRWKHGWMSSCLEGCEDAYKANRRSTMFHADYFEPKAQMFRAAAREHLDVRCSAPGCNEQVCPEAVLIDDDYKECRFAGCQGGTRMPVRIFGEGFVLCGMCY